MSQEQTSGVLSDEGSNHHAHHRLLLLIFGSSLLLQAGEPPQNSLPPPDPLSSYFRTGVLDFDSRVWAERQVQKIYHAHRIWPKENPGPKPPFEQMVPAALIEKKAIEPLRMSSALKQFWNVEITPAMLQTEMDRMERESKDRAMLHELFKALHDDPFLIAETLARGNLAEKALRNHYAYDVNLHADTRRRAEEIAAQVKDGSDWSGLEANYSHRHIKREDDAANAQEPMPHRERAEEIRISGEDFTTLQERLTKNNPAIFREEDSGYLFERKVSGNDSDLEIESLFLPKRSFDQWWAETESVPPVESILTASSFGSPTLTVPLLLSSADCGSWLPTSTGANTPTARNSHTSVWTGSEMIIWGGLGNPEGYLNSGGRYNLATDSWLPTSTSTNVPSRAL